MRARRRFESTALSARWRDQPGTPSDPAHWTCPQKCTDHRGDASGLGHHLDRPLERRRQGLRSAAVRFITCTSTKRSAVGARATPPAPSTATVPASPPQRGLDRVTSVLNACNCPEASTCNVLAAPERRVASSHCLRSATNEANVPLCGKVTDKPRRSSPGGATKLRGHKRRGIRDGQGKYTALRCCSAKAWLWKLET